MTNKVGRPKGSGKYPVRKHIYISEEMNKKWNPDNIRDFLSNGKQNKKSVFEESDFERALYKYLFGIVWRGKTEDLQKELKKGINKIRGK